MRCDPGHSVSAGGFLALCIYFSTQKLRLRKWKYPSRDARLTA